MGRLYDLLQAHMDAQPYEVTAADIARRIGVSRQTILNWRKPEQLLKKEHLLSIAQVTGVPYHRVLDALLEDIGYLNPEQDAASVTDLSGQIPKVSDEQLGRVAKRPRKQG